MSCEIKRSTSSALQAQILRKKYQYRSLVLHAQTALPRDGAVHLVGPDCTYHLYRTHQAARYISAFPKPSIAAYTVATNRAVLIEILNFL